MIDLNVPTQVHVLGDGTRIVLFQITGTYQDLPIVERNRNIFRLHPDGGVIWRVPLHRSDYDDPFVGFRFESDRLLGFTWDGWRFEIDIIDGSLKNLGWSK